MKCPDFELLSAYADQELSPTERAVVEAHLQAGCAQCSQQLAGLGQVGTQLRQPLGLPFQIKVQALRAGWWQRLRSLADSPVVHLVSLQRRRRARYGAAEMARMAALFALPMLFMCLSEDRSSLTAFLLFSALGLMVGLPLRQFGEEVALLASLQRGRCLDEIVSTGTSAQGVLDGLALQGLMQIGKAALTVWPVLLLGTLGLPPQWQLQAWELELLWLPGLAALFLAGYYFAQFVQVFPGGGLRRMLVAAALLSPAALLEFGAAGAFAAALITGLAARQLAIQGLSNPERPRAVPVHRRNPLVRSFSQNPIARRELGRLAGQMGGNWMRLAVWRASMMVLPVAWALQAVSAPMVKWPDVFAGAVLVFSALFFVRSALRTLPAVVREREQKSWEILMQTRLGGRAFISGWLQVCLYTVFSEGILALLALGGYGLAMVPRASWPQAALGLAVIPAMALLGALVGLAISASSPDSRQASQNLVRWSLLGLSGWLGTLGLFGGERIFPGSDHRFVCGTPSQPEFAPMLGFTSLFSLVPVALMLAAMAGRQLRLLSCIDPEESPQVENSTRYSPVVFSLDLASLAGLYYGLSLWKQFSSLLDLTALQGVSLLIAGALVWWLLVRMPLATVAEAALGGRINLLIGIGYGLAMGQVCSLAWGSHPIQRNWISQDMVPPTLLLCSLALGAILGVLAAGSRPISDGRVQVLIRRLNWSWVTVVTVLGVAATVYLNQVPPFRGASSGYIGTRYGRQEQTFQKLLFAHPNKGDLYARILENGMPEFGVAGPPTPSPFFHVPPQDWAPLQSIAIAQKQRGDGEQALNTMRWWLLCSDRAPIYQSDMTFFRDEDDQAYRQLEELLSQFNLKPETGRALIEQLLDESSLQNQLLAGYGGALRPVDRIQEPSTLPNLYLEREQAALALAQQRADLTIQQFDLWQLQSDRLLADVRFCPLARRQLNNPALKVRLEGVARLATRREELALRVAIQLYRQDHGGAWPESLEQVQRGLPRPARCYLNRQGTFDYKPGSLSSRS